MCELMAVLRYGLVYVFQVSEHQENKKMTLESGMKEHRVEDQYFLHPNNIHEYHSNWQECHFNNKRCPLHIIYEYLTS